MNLKVNVGNFRCNLPNKVSIARSQPAGFELTALRIIEPDRTTLLEYKNSDRSEEAWRNYAASYKQELLRNLLAWTYDEGDLPTMLVDFLFKVARDLGVEEITLCCWEHSADERCHRKLVYDWLPDNVKGERR